MSVLPVGFGSAAGGTPAGAVERSLRFNSADSAYLNRTPASAPSNADIGTWSFWVKRTKLGVEEYIFGSRDGTNVTLTGIRFISTDALEFLMFSGGTALARRITTQVFRDPSAWAHFVIVYNSTLATAGDRVKVYVNGVEITTFSTTTNPSQNQDLIRWAANGIPNYVGNEGTTLGNYGDYYLTEVYYLDGQFPTTTTRTVNGITETILTQLGEFDSATGVWIPKAWTGTYGTNGFYLKFADNSGTTSTTLGKDSSGNGNNWTPNLFSVTAGAGNDSLVDSPTNYGTDTGVGGEVRGNYATLNPVVPSSGRTSLSNGNLQALGTSSVESGCNYGTIGVSSGKWYWECTVLAVSSASSYPNFGAVRVFSSAAGQSIGSSVTGGAGIFTGGTVYKEGSLVTTVSSYTTNDVIGIALDVDSLTCAFYKNGTLLTTVTGLTAGTYWPGIASYYNSSTALNTGQRPFQKWNGSAYVANTAPSGFKALCTQNFTTPTIGATSTTQAGKYFGIKTYTGNNSTNVQTGLGFQPDMLWFKSRSGAYQHGVFDAVRGSTKGLEITTQTELTSGSTQDLVSFDSDGFTLGSIWNFNSVNGNALSQVAWAWKANGAGSSNTDGQITSTVSVNTTSKFSIVTYTGNGSANQTVGHGLGVAPTFGILKDRDANSNNSQWQVFHTVSGDNYAYLSTTAAFTGTAQFYPTTASSTTVTVGRDVAANTNESGDRFVMYLFADVDGYSKAFSYASNNSADNAFVYLGFRPRWIMIKSESTGGTNYDWVIYDTARMTYNYIANTELRANLTTTEGGLARNPPIDILSNGFKVRGSGGEIGSSTLYVGMAFAETPFKYSLAR